MPTLDDVINFILTTEEVSDLPTIGDALNERFATEIGLVAEDSEPEGKESTPEEAPVEAPKKEPALPPLAL